MADFTEKRQFTTREAVLQVDKGLPAGVHTFELVVMDDSGNRSKAAQVRVSISRIAVPVIPLGPVVVGPVIDIIRPPIRRNP